MNLSADSDKRMGLFILVIVLLQTARGEIPIPAGRWKLIKAEICEVGFAFNWQDRYETSCAGELFGEYQVIVAKTEIGIG
ncbi:hypothetical protein J6590_051458 [Homalodisca vitripennis]|nr:hypothetical protein J6590_051458 [Homalodisca vitripennis]